MTLVFIVLLILSITLVRSILRPSLVFECAQTTAFIYANFQSSVNYALYPMSLVLLFLSTFCQSCFPIISLGALEKTANCYAVFFSLFVLFPSRFLIRSFPNRVRPYATEVNWVKPNLKNTVLLCGSTKQ